MKITIETIPHKDQRYPTVGDWQWDEEGNLSIKVSRTCSIWSERLVALHELVEAILCRAAGITTEMVDKFDKDHLELDEPGNDIRAPYHREHVDAEIMERLFASMLKIEWETHESNLTYLELS